MAGFGDSNLRGDRSIPRCEEELPHHEPVEPVDFDLESGDLGNLAARFPGEEPEGNLLHPRGELVEPPAKPINGNPSGFHEILDHYELRTLIDNREPGEAADRLVDFFELPRREFFPTLDSDRVASDDVVARDDTRRRLRTVPLVCVNARLGRNREVVKGAHPHAKAAVVLDREVQDRPWPNPVRFGPRLRKGNPQARVSELLYLSSLEFHENNKYRQA